MINRNCEMGSGCNQRHWDLDLHLSDFQPICDMYKEGQKEQAIVFYVVVQLILTHVGI